MVADGVTHELNRHPPHVFDHLGFFLEEIVYPVSGQEQEGSLVAEVLDTSDLFLFAPAALEFGDRDLVFGQQLLIHVSQILGLRNRALDIEPVTVLQVARR